MAKPVYSRCLYRQAPQLGSLPLPGTGGTDTIVIRDICFGATAAGVSTLFVNDELGATLVEINHTFGTLATHWEGRQVINPGQSVAVIVLTVPATVRICGYLLTP